MRFLSNTMLQSLDIPVPVDCHCCGSPLLQLDPFIPSPRTVYWFGIHIVVTCHTCSPRIDDGRLTTSHLISKAGQTNGRMYTAYDGNWNGFVVDDDSVEFNNNFYYNANIVATRLLDNARWSGAEAIDTWAIAYGGGLQSIA